MSRVAEPIGHPHLTTFSPAAIGWIATLWPTPIMSRSLTFMVSSMSTVIPAASIRAATATLSPALRRSRGTTAATQTEPGEVGLGRLIDASFEGLRDTRHGAG